MHFTHSYECTQARARTCVVIPRTNTSACKQTYTHRHSSARMTTEHAQDTHDDTYEPHFPRRRGGSHRARTAPLESRRTSMKEALSSNRAPEERTREENYVKSDAARVADPAFSSSDFCCFVMGHKFGGSARRRSSAGWKRGRGSKRPNDCWGTCGEFLYAPIQLPMNRGGRCRNYRSQSKMACERHVTSGRDVPTRGAWRDA